MAFGTGSAMAHRAVDAVLGPRVIQHETVASPAPAAAVGIAAPAPSTTSFEGRNVCGDHSKALQDVCFLLLLTNWSICRSLDVYLMDFSFFKDTNISESF